MIKSRRDDRSIKSLSFCRPLSGASEVVGRLFPYRRRPLRGQEKMRVRIPGSPRAEAPQPCLTCPP